MRFSLSARFAKFYEVLARSDEKIRKYKNRASLLADVSSLLEENAVTFATDESEARHVLRSTLARFRELAAEKEMRHALVRKELQATLIKERGALADFLKGVMREFKLGAVRRVFV